MKFRKALILSVLVVFGIISLLIEDSSAVELKQQQIKVFSTTAGYSDGLEAATSSINVQIADFLDKEKVDIISSNMFTSAIGSAGTWKFFVTVSVTYTRR